MAITVLRGEKRRCSIDFANDPAIVAGAALTGTPSVTIVNRRGGASLGVLSQTPAAPTRSGTAVVFWVDVLTWSEITHGIVRATCGTDGNETAKAKDYLEIL